MINRSPLGTAYAASAGPCLSPRGLAALEGLSRRERIMVLRQWERAELAAREPAENGRTEAPRTRLREIAQAIADLQHHTTPEARGSEGETELECVEAEPEEIPSPSAPEIETWGLEERRPVGPIQWVQAVLLVGVLGVLIALETRGGAIGVGMIMLSLVILLMLILSQRPRPGPRV